MEIISLSRGHKPYKLAKHGPFQGICIGFQLFPEIYGPHLTRYLCDNIEPVENNKHTSLMYLARAVLLILNNRPFSRHFPFKL